jgi:error-prone DNA polymerase
LPELGPWERVVADYKSTGMTLGEHPMALLRGELDDDVLGSARLERVGDGAQVRVAGMVVARQRPATAKGIVFMLLEDDRGTINLIIPPPVVERCRWAVRTAGFVIARGKLEHREGTTNVIVTEIKRLEAGEVHPAEPLTVAPSVRHETGRDHKAWRGQEVISELDRPGRSQIVAELVAALPARQSFGRRG